MKKKHIWWIIGILALVLLVFLVIRKQKKQGLGFGVDMATPTVQDLTESIQASGKIYPQKEIKVASEVSGELVQLLVKEGDVVTKNQVLARINPEAIESSVAQGKASVTAARAQLASNDAQINNAKAGMDQISVQLENARANLTRSKQLYADKVISTSEYESAQTQVNNLEASLRAAEASYQSMIENYNAGKSNVERAEASLSEMKTMLSRTTIYAPDAGIVSRLNVEEGEQILGMNQFQGTEILRISNFENMEVRVEVNEQDIVHIDNNDSVLIEVDAYPDVEFYGRVSSIASSATNLTGSLDLDQSTSYIVKIAIDPNSYAAIGNKKFPFRPGMSASVDIITQMKSDVLSVPILAVTTRDMSEDKFREEVKEVIFVVRADTVAIQEIKTGIQDLAYIEVLEGVNRDDKIVTGPYSTVSKLLKSGSKVHERQEENKKKPWE